MSDLQNENMTNDALSEQKIGALISSCLYKLEYISDHHVKERRRHFRITNIFIVIVSALILIIAASNLYNLLDFYDETNLILNSVNNLDKTVENVSTSMKSITVSMGKINAHMTHMEGVYQDISSIGEVLPLMQENMVYIGKDMGGLNQNMHGITKDMGAIDHHISNMSGNVSGIRYNVKQMSDLAGPFNSMMP